MRKDMHKVICEEPRHGGGYDKQNRRANVPFEDLPKFESIMKGYSNRKRFGEHLGPLRRWLRSKIGHQWDEVYSEACKVIKPDSVVRNHIKFHLLDMVVRHTFMQNGEIWCFHSHWRMEGIPLPQAGSRWTRFYVDPTTRLLGEIPPRAKSTQPWQRAERERAGTQRTLPNGLRLMKLNGIWFECRLQPFPKRVAKGESPLRYDMAEKRNIGPGQASHIYEARAYCTAKRQLSRRELKRFGLSNSPGFTEVGARSSACRHSGRLTIALQTFQAGRR
jgi:hypothetical protein